jgi:hypothetical protein
MKFNLCVVDEFSRGILDDSLDGGFIFTAHASWPHGNSETAANWRAERITHRIMNDKNVIHAAEAWDEPQSTVRSKFRRAGPLVLCKELLIPAPKPPQTLTSPECT